MRLIVGTHGTVHLRVKDEKSDFDLTMDYDDQLEQFQMHLTDGEGTVTPKTPLKRYPGEGDEVYFDRCCVTAYRHYLEAVEIRILEQSRFERVEHVRRLIETEIGAIEQTFTHWDNDKPDDADLRRMDQALQMIRNTRDAVTDVG